MTIHSPEQSCNHTFDLSEQIVGLDCDDGRRGRA
jgi:hypothetical protein